MFKQGHTEIKKKQVYFELELCVFIGIFKTLMRMEKPVFSVSWECLVLTFQTDELRHGAITATRPHLYCVSGKPGTSPGNPALPEEYGADGEGCF